MTFEIFKSIIRFHCDCGILGLCCQCYSHVLNGNKGIHSSELSNRLSSSTGGQQHHWVSSQDVDTHVSSLQYHSIDCPTSEDTYALSSELLMFRKFLHLELEMWDFRRIACGFRCWGRISYLKVSSRLNSTRVSIEILIFRKRSSIEAASSESIKPFLEPTSKISLISHTKSISLTSGIVKLVVQLASQNSGKTNVSTMKSAWAITNLLYLLAPMALSKAHRSQTLARDSLCLITLLYFNAHPCILYLFWVQS